MTVAPAFLIEGDYYLYKAANTGEGSELVSELILLNEGGSKETIFSLDLGAGKVSPQLGDLLVARVDYQVTTNEPTFYIFVADQLLLSNIVNTDAGNEVNQAQGTNLYPDVHHLGRTRVGSCVIDDLSRLILNLRVSAESSVGEGTLPVTVDNSKGQLSYELYRLRTPGISITLDATIT